MSAQLQNVLIVCVMLGFALMEFPTKEEAMGAARRFMKVHQEILGPKWEGTLEIHEVFTA